MKKYLLFILIISTLVLKAQSLSYVDQAVLFSTDDNYGTARFTAMGGAFGALGGDMTAVDINPAGLAIYTSTGFSTTLSYRETNTKSTFYGSSINNSDDNFRFSQVGGTVVIPNYGNSDFKKFTLGFNYNLIKDYNNNFAVQGNSGIPTYVDDPFLNFDDDDSNNIYYNNMDQQFFSNYTSGINDRFTLSFATQYKDFLYLGASLSFQNINFYQNIYYEEYNNDGNGNNLDAFLTQDLSTYGNGFNFGFGAILKPYQNLRLGLSYQSPIWYNLSENSIQYKDPSTGELFAGDFEIYVSNNPDEFYAEYGEPYHSNYDLNTPSKLTGSLAYIFGQNGLISFDYTYRDYTSTKLKPSSFFIDENKDLNTILNGTSSFKIGTEWRVKNFSFRGGYRYTESPYKNTDSSANINGYSLGLGIKLSRTINFDFAFDNTTYSDSYAFVNNQNVIPAKLDIDTNRFTSTLVINF